MDFVYDFSFIAFTFSSRVYFDVSVGFHIMPDIVNDCLGIAQFITNGRSEQQATAYLQTIEGLSIEDWRSCKSLLPGVDRTNRHTKESHIRDVVTYLKNEDIDDHFCVRDLSLFPGFQKSALELVDYLSATLYSVQRTIASFSIQQGLATPPSRSRDNQSNNTPSNLLQQPEFPPLEFSGFPAQTHAPLPPPGDWQKSNRKGKVAKQQNPTNTAKNPRKSWIHGTSTSVNSSISHQMKFVCLGVRTGANETEASLKKELEEWKYPKDLKVEAVRKSDFSSTFRVQYNAPAIHHAKWREPSVWPARMSATEWRGNPKAQLKPLAERQYTKRIYIGNLSETATTEDLTANMQYIYREEIQNKLIHSVEAHMNYAGIERARKMKAQDPMHEVMKSACIVLTSYPGCPLTDVGLKLDDFEDKIRRTVRRWNGPIPRPKTNPATKLNW